MSEHTIDHAHDAHAIVHEEHPGPMVYIVVAVVLCILTGMEIGVFYAPALQSVLVPLLIVLAIAKFILVASFYMHLWYDSTVFSIFFVFPLMLAVLICISLMLLFGYLSHHMSIIRV
jgi:cytochrome c oxidase subunit IV